MGKLEGKNRQLGVVKDLRAQVASIEDRIIFYMVCYELLDSDSYRISQLQRIFTKRDEMQLRRALQDGQHPLQRKGLVELTGGGIFDNGELKLTEKGKEVFLEEDAALFQSNYTDKNLLHAAKSPEKGCSSNRNWSASSPPCATVWTKTTIKPSAGGWAKDTCRPASRCCSMAHRERAKPKA